MKGALRAGLLAVLTGAALVTYLSERQRDRIQGPRRTPAPFFREAGDTALAAYIAARKAVRPWLVVVPTCLPRGDHLGSHYTATTGEVELLAANNYLKNNYRGMGIHRLVDIRQGPFSFTDPTNAANFPSSLWVDKTHPNTAGHAYTAGYIADALVNLRPRN